LEQALRPLFVPEIRCVVPNCGIVVLEIQGEYRHWIAINNGIVHDPEFSSAFIINRYPRKHWKVVVYLKPAEEESLDNHSAHKRALIMRKLGNEISEAMEAKIVKALWPPPEREYDDFPGN
jgi:hypothetical protein